MSGFVRKGVHLSLEHAFLIFEKLKKKKIVSKGYQTEIEKQEQENDTYRHTETKGIER